MAVFGRIHHVLPTIPDVKYIQEHYSSAFCNQINLTTNIMIQLVTNKHLIN